MPRKAVPQQLHKPADRIWLVENAWSDSDGYRTSEIVMGIESEVRRAEADGWRVTEYVKVETKETR